jgi:hypothetical protein
MICFHGATGSGAPRSHGPINVSQRCQGRAMLDRAVRPIRSRRSRRDLWCRFDLDENGRAAPAGKRQGMWSPMFVSPCGVGNARP